VYIEPGEEHWHGAKPTRFMAHIAMKKPTTTVKSSPIRLPPRGVTPAASTRLAVVGNRGVAVVKDAASEHKNSTMAASFSRRPSRPFGSHLVMVIPVLRGYCSCFVPTHGINGVPVIQSILQRISPVPRRAPHFPDYARRLLRSRC
jgi:hypothetical protein